MDILQELNSRQKEAVTTTEGRIRVIAGAGSGKTKALVYRYAYLVNQFGIDPSNILCVTFTNKAAREMTNRLSRLVSSGLYNDFVCTFHGFCVKILRRDIYRLGYPKTFTILDEEDAKSLAKEVMNELGIERKSSTADKMLKRISWMKCTRQNDYIDPYMLAGYEFTEKDNTDPELSFLRLQTKMFALDFDDLIFFALYLLEKYEDCRTYWQQELNYIMVDEAQDCSRSEWKLVEILAAGHGNLFVVGDPDQLIYEWRGVVPVDFIDFKSGKDIIMDENYRSTPKILDVANSIIANNKNRIPKNLFTQKPLEGEVIHFHGKSETEEAHWVSARIKSICRDFGAKFSDFAILYRASYLSRFIEEELIQSQIKSTIWGGIRFFERKEIKDALSYLRLIAVNDDLSFKRIANVPSRKFGKKFMEKLFQAAEIDGTNLFTALKNHKDDPEIHREKADEFVNLIDECKERSASEPISELLDFVIRKSGYFEELRSDGDEERLENYYELVKSIRYYEEANREEEISLQTYLQDISLYTNADYRQDTDTVKLMTIHQAKGLEFPFVFVIGMSEGVLPNYHTIREYKKAGEEEERRLAYVAITRAEKAVFLTESEGYNSSTGTSKYPSRFLREIKSSYLVKEGNFEDRLWTGTDEMIESLSPQPKKPCEFSAGSFVRHVGFGEGIVIEVNEERKSCRVKFEHGERNILFPYLEIIKKQSD